MYSLSIGLSSKSKVLFAFCLICGVMFSIVFGADSTVDSTIFPYEKYISIVVLVLIFFVHAAERYNTHVVDRIPFLDFSE